MSAVRTSFDKLVSMPAAALIDQFTGKPDPGLESDAKLEARIDAEYASLISSASSEGESKDSFDRFYRLVLARSQIAQVRIELERRKFAR